MARGFGTTFGAGTTDSVNTGYTGSWPTAVHSTSSWININGSGGGTLGRVWGTNGAGCSLAMAFGTTNIDLFINFSVQQGQFTIASPALNTWHHLGVTYDSGNVANVPLMYMDGVSQSVTVTQVPIGTLSAESNIYFGNRSDGIRNWDGMLAECAAWNVILTPNEILSLSKGTLPFNIRGVSLLTYCPINGVQASEPDWGPSHFSPTTTGTKFQPHAPVKKITSLLAAI